MSSLELRLERLENKGPKAGRPSIIPFATDGMTEQEIEEELARQDERAPMTVDEWSRSSVWIIICGKPMSEMGKGRPGSGGSKGAPNKVTALLKQAITQVAEAEGRDGAGKDGLRGCIAAGRQAKSPGPSLRRSARCCQCRWA